MKVLQAKAYLNATLKKLLIIFLLVFHPLWLNAAEPWVYVTNNRSDSMNIINTANDEVLTTIPVGKEPHEVAITPDGENVVAVVDLYELRVVKRIPTSLAPDGIAIARSPEGLKLLF